jgi:hypothetical protein
MFCGRNVFVTLSVIGYEFGKLHGVILEGANLKLFYLQVLCTLIYCCTPLCLF